MSNDYESKTNYYNNSWAFVTLPHGTELTTGIVRRTEVGANLVGPLGEWQPRGGETNVEAFVGKHHKPYVAEPQWSHWVMDEDESIGHRLKAVPELIQVGNETYCPSKWGEWADVMSERTSHGMKYYKMSFSWQDQLIPNSIHKRFWVRMSQEELHPDPARELADLIRMIARKEGA